MPRRNLKYRGLCSEALDRRTQLSLVSALGVFLASRFSIVAFGVTELGTISVMLIDGSSRLGRCFDFGIKIRDYILEGRDRLLDGGVWDVFFLDLYHPRKSRRAPTGYRIAADAEREKKLFFGANEFVASFPDQLPDAISNTNERLIGGRSAPAYQVSDELCSIALC